MARVQAVPMHMQGSACSTLVLFFFIGPGICLTLMTESTQPVAPASEAPAPTFADFGLHPLLLQSIAETGYTTPTPIQAQAIPVVVEGRDVMGAAQTGTGKTAAFTLPILHRLMPLANTSASPARHPVRALILTPTRELADQVYESVKRYSKQTPLRSAVVFGGVDIGPQKEALRRGCEVLVATPGRLLDHVEQKNVNLSQVGILVLDEADRMLDMGFLPDLERIIRLLPAQRQGLLFSATFSNEIRKLGRSYLNHPVEIEVAARNATAATITQIAYKMPSDAKRAAVVHLVKSRGLKQVIVFSNTKIGTARLARELERDGVKAESIHGDKTQADRMKALEAFRPASWKCWWPPTWPRAAWTWPACPASSTTTCRTTPKTTCTASAAPAAPAPRARPSRCSRPTKNASCSTSKS